jgi:hypothetical protein
VTTTESKGYDVETVEEEKRETGEAFSNLSNFLELVAFTALLLGCLGVASSIYVYAKSKVMVERELVKLADDSFTPVFLRNATVFGYSPRLRLDLVVNNLAASGYLRGVVEVLSDGTPWRPSLHVKDCAAAFIYLMEQPAQIVRGKSYNIGMDESNMRVADIAKEVAKKIAKAKIEVKGVDSKDERTYRVNFARVVGLGWRGRYLVEDGAEELIGAFEKWGFIEKDFVGGRYNTLCRYKEMMERGVMDSRLRVKREIGVKA